MPNACEFDRFPTPSRDFDHVKMFKSIEEEIDLAMGQTVYVDDLDSISLDSFDSLLLLPNYGQERSLKGLEADFHENSHEELFIDDLHDYEISSKVKEAVDQAVWKYTGLMF